MLSSVSILDLNHIQSLTQADQGEYSGSLNDNRYLTKIVLFAQLARDPQSPVLNTDDEANRSNHLDEPLVLDTIASRNNHDNEIL